MSLYFYKEEMIMTLETIETPGNTSWFVNDRFGLFIHWGLYALAARHEWVKSREEIDDEQYRTYFEHFDPDLYDPDVWAEAASGAGMKYFVITTKHHEGFCLWDSDLTDYKATNTPCGRDLLEPMVKAFRSRDMKTGFYHSLIDWHHPEYVIDNRNHPQRNHPERDTMNKGRDQMKYADYLHGQVRELLTRFDPVDILWFDFSFPNGEDRADFSRGKGREAWRSEELYRLVRELAPDVVLDDRIDLEKGWDVKTPEQFQPREWVRVNGTPVVWEACQTFSGSWGYYRDEDSWRSVNELLSTLIDCVSKGGNLLLNVGPTGRGEFDYRALDRLEGMGKWMKSHSRSIYGCTQAPEEFRVPENCSLTYNSDTGRIYIHMLSWPYKHIFLDGTAWCEQVEYAQLLNDASEIPFEDAGSQQVKRIERKEIDALKLTLPVKQPRTEIPVIEVFLK